MKEFSTPLSRKIGLRYPLVAAPMFIISNREMLYACAEAGILGAMPSLNCRTIETFREDLAWVKNKTDKPFAINVTIGLTAPERLMQDVAACIEFEVPVMIAIHRTSRSASFSAKDGSSKPPRPSPPMHLIPVLEEPCQLLQQSSAMGDATTCQTSKD